MSPDRSAPMYEVWWHGARFSHLIGRYRSLSAARTCALRYSYTEIRFPDDRPRAIVVPRELRDPNAEGSAPL